MAEDKKTKLPPTGAGAGRGFVNPQRTDESDETYVTPSQRYEMEKQRQEDRETRQNEKAYNKSLTSMKKGGTASSRADGICQRGKTKGAYV